MEDQLNDLEDVKINWRRQKSRPYYLTMVILIANLSMISHDCLQLEKYLQRFLKIMELCSYCQLFFKPVKW